MSGKRITAWFDRWAWLVLASTTAAGLVVYYSVPFTDLQTHVARLAFTSVVAGVCIVYAVLHPQLRQSPWMLIACASILNVIGDMVMVGWTYRYASDPAFPSVADALYLGYYAIVVFAVLIVMHAYRRRSVPGSVIDPIIATIGVGFAVWVMIVQPSVGHAGASIVQGLVFLAYLVFDFLLLSVVARLFLVTRMWNWSYALLAVATVFNVVGSVVCGVQTAWGTFEHGSWVEATWIVANAMVALAVLHPHAREARLEQPMRASDMATRIPPSLAVVIMFPLILLSSTIWRSADNRIAFVTVSAILSMLVFIRFSTLMRFIRRIVHELCDKRRRLMVSMEEVRAYCIDRQRLLRQIVRASEQERQFLSAELHDGPVQSLAAAAYRCEHLEVQLAGDGDDVRAQLARDLRELLVLQIRELRTMMARLRPPALHERGVIDALQDMVRTVEHDTGVTVNLMLEELVETGIPDYVGVVMYRVAQEAMANIMKHAHPTSVTVMLCVEDDEFLLSIKDDGAGFDLDWSRYGTGGHHMGILLMRERVEAIGGTFEIMSRRGWGTVVKARIPLDELSDEREVFEGVQEAERVA